MTSIVSLTPLVLLAILIFLTLFGKVSYGHGLGDIVYYPIPFILFAAQSCFIYFAESNLALNIFSVITLLLTCLTVIKITIRRGPENTWRGPNIPFIKTTAELMDEKMLKDFDKLIAKDPKNEELKKEKKLFLEHRKNLEK